LRAVLVGGVGFLGAALAEKLSRDGWDVVVAARASSLRRRGFIARALGGMGVRVEARPGGLDASTLESLGGDVYYHLAGSISGPKRRMWEAHVGLAGEVAEAAGRLGARLVYVSAVTATGRIAGAGPGSRVVEEEAHMDPRLVRPETPFEETKAEGERLVASQRRLRWSIVRPGLLVGRWGYHPEWVWVARLSRLGLAPGLAWAPLSPVRGVAEVLELAGEGRYDNLWLNAVACTCDLYRVTGEACRLLRGGRCRRLEASRLLALARLAPPTSPAREAWAIARRRYIYASRRPQPEWPAPEEAAREWVEWWASRS
jgi:nucleoside-diphosphate-sugar epimerase